MRHPLHTLGLWLLLLSTATAGTGPETTLLVVNAESPLSLTVANHWMASRPIPQNHVVWLSDIPTLDTLTMAQFRERILEPIQRFMESEGLDEEIDTIVYSADFPFAVALRQELKKHGIKNDPYIGSAASLTGLTYFMNQVLDGEIGYVTTLANGYFRRPVYPPPKAPSALTKKAKERKKRARKALNEGDFAEAYELLKEVVENHAADAQVRVSMARILAQLGRREAALQQLEAAYRLGWDNSLKLRNDKWLAPLRKTEGFQALIRKMERPRVRFEPPQGFRAQRHWSRTFAPGQRGDRDRYRLSAMLAYTGQRGNALPEIARYLDRSRRSDGSHPRGTVYLMENHDIRTETRQPWFDETCDLLRKIGHRCEILTRGRDGEDGIIPKKRRDIIGLVAGTRTFNWKKSGSRLLPGAFADAFTSYAGDFDNASQTKLTEFLRQGASGSSGAVVEPYSFAEKFPLPLLHYYYALGYSLAESWYMAVASPYQNILVGDPLTQPFLEPVELSIRNPAIDQPWKGTVALSVKVAGSTETRIDHLELWIDGRPVARAAPGSTLEWDTTTVADGHHQLHLVAVEALPREGRHVRHHWIRVDNDGLSATLTADQDTAPYATPFFLNGTAPAGSRISIRQGRRELLSFTTDTFVWETILPTSPLGMGKVTLQAVAVTPEGKEIFSNPLTLTVTRAHLERAGANVDRHQKGLTALLVYSDDHGRLHHEKRVLSALDGRLGDLLKKNMKLERIALIGWFQVKRSGFHQLAIHTQGAIEVLVDGRSHHKTAPEDHYGMVYLPLFLEKGWHRLEIRPHPQGVERLKVVLSGESIPTVLGHGRIRTTAAAADHRRQRK